MTYRPTTDHAGPYRIVTHHQRRGWYIVDERTGRPAWTRPSPTTGRPIAAALPSLAAARAALAELARPPPADDEPPPWTPGPDGPGVAMSPTDAPPRTRRKMAPAVTPLD